MNDRDLLIRTIIGEANGQPVEGQKAVAHVILNRLKSGQWGDSIRKVVLAKHQFEPWSTRRKELLSIDPNSPEYRRTAALVDNLGDDPTGGATHFLNADIVRQRRGGSLPKWAENMKGSAHQIGQHTFFGGTGNPSGQSAMVGGGGSDTLAGGDGLDDLIGKEVDALLGDGLDDVIGKEIDALLGSDAALSGAPDAPAQTPDGPAEGRLPFQTHISGGDVYARQAAQTAPESDGPSFFGKMVDAAGTMVNDVISGQQRVNPVSAAKEVPIGILVGNDDAPRVRFTEPGFAKMFGADASSEASIDQFTKDKFFTQYDAKTGQTLVYQRTPETEDPALVSLGRMVGMGASSTVPAGTTRAAARAAEAARLAEEAQSGATASAAFSGEMGASFKLAGVDPEQVTKDVVANFAERAKRSGLTPETARRAAADEFEIPLSRGQATGDFSEIAFEEAARVGGRGKAAGDIARAAQETQIAAIEKALDAQVPGTAQAADEAGSRVVAGLREARNSARNDVRAAYEAIPDGTVIDVRAVKSLLAKATGALEEITLNPSPQATGALAQIAKLARRVARQKGAVGIDFKAIEGLRKQLNAISRRLPDQQQAYEVASIKKSLDDWIEQSVENALISGDDAALVAVKEARAKYSAFKQVFTKQGAGDDAGRIIENLTDPIKSPEGVTPQEVVRYLYGASQVGAAPHSVRVARKIGEILGKGSPEWDALRQGAWLRVIKGPRASQSPGNQALASRIIDFVDGDGKALTRELFTSDELNQMKRLANVLKMTVPPKGATNPSGTAAAVARLVGDSFSNIGTSIGLMSGNIGATFGAKLLAGVTSSARTRFKSSRAFDPRGSREWQLPDIAGPVRAAARVSPAIVTPEKNE